MFPKHLGQGANQAFEDTYHLIRLLVKHNPKASPPSTELLSNVFRDYEGIRIPRTAELVKGARKQGEVRVVDGVEACLARNEVVRKIWEEDEQVLNALDYLLSGPFRGESGI